MSKSIRNLSILLVLLLSFTFILSGCSAKEETVATAAPQTETKTETVVQAAPEVSSVEKAAMDYFANKAEDNNMIAQDAFVAKVKEGGDFFILDIRRADDYAAAHVKGAVNAPWGPAIAENLSKLPEDKTIYLYCYSGQTAGQTVALLNMAGFDVKSVRYGYSLGISKVEGYEEITETTANFFDPSVNTKVDSDIAAAITDYYATLNADENTKSNIISASAAKAMLDASEGEIVVVSIRQAADYAKGHIAGAVNIPWAKGMQESFADLPKDKQLFVYCYSGQTAGQTVAVLKMLGYDAASIKSGMGTAGTGGSGWMVEGFPVVQ